MDKIVELHIAGVMASLFFLVAFGNAVKKAIDNVRDKKERCEISPQPLEVRTVSGGASERDCKARYEEHEKEIAALKAQREEDQKTGRIERAGMYKKIDETRKELSVEINAIPAQVITILNNTGAINRKGI